MTSKFRQLITKADNIDDLSDQDFHTQFAHPTSVDD
jgi:hypothetical protein